MSHAASINSLLEADFAVQRLLPFLTDLELTRLASTCQAWKQAVSFSLIPWLKDVSEGLERRPIPCKVSVRTILSAIALNGADRTAGTPGSSSIRHRILGNDFTYTKDNVLPSTFANNSGTKGCSCSPPMDCNTSNFCSCMSEDRLITDKEVPVTCFRALQCGPACACSLNCPLKVTQNGLAVQLQLLSSCKGWSALTCQDIAKGAFVAQYAGEVISNKEAERRLEAYDAYMQTTGHALLIVRETLPSGNACLRMNIDATNIGNVARFFNHSCDGGNLSLDVVRSRGNLLPCVALFANRQIKQGEELTFSYGPSRSELRLPVQSDTAIEAGMQSISAEADSTARRRRPCLCGTAACLGFLPGA